MTIRQISGASYQHRAVRAALWPVRALRRRWFRYRDANANKILDQLARLLVEDPVLKVDEFNGTFALSSRSDLFRRILTAGSYESTLTKTIEKYIDRQRDAIDVGANIGFQTVLMSKIISNRKVLAIEPTRNALIRLRRNLKLNAAEKNVIIFDGVASDVNETTSIKVLEGREEYSTLGVVSHPSVVGDSGSFTTERVQARTLDQLADDFNLDVGFIKVDAEGHEHKIFDGAKVLLTTQRPIVISELSDTLLRKNGSSALAVIRYFEALDYVVSDPLNAKATPGLRQFGDIVCVPSERQQS